MSQEFFIVEHESRGCYIGMNSNSKPKCSYTILRSDKKVRKFTNIEDARAIRNLIPHSYVLRYAEDRKNGFRFERCA